MNSPTKDYFITPDQTIEEPARLATLLDLIAECWPLTAQSYNRPMAVFNDKEEELQRYEFMMGVPRGRLAVTLDMITDAMALVGQHGVYCQSQRWPGKPVMDIQIIMKNLTDAKELIQSVMEELKPGAQKKTAPSQTMSS